MALIFFVLIPGIGAFSVRSDWRKFRARMIRASFLPYLDYSDLQGYSRGKSFRLFGQLEAIRSRDQIWINSGSFSVAADLRHVPIYILPGPGPDEEPKVGSVEEQPQSIPWRQISSLAAKTPVFIAGSLEFERGQPEFRSESKEPLLVVLYGGDKRSLMKRAIRGGRQRNEYWNQFTLVSLITGSIGLFLLAYFSFVQYGSRLSSIVSIALGLSPIMPLLPPGMLPLLLYRHYWRKARVLRSERDLQRLPTRYFPVYEGRTPMNPEDGEAWTTKLPNGEPYVMTCGQEEELRGRIQHDPRSEITEIPLTIPPSDSRVYLFGVLRDERVAQPEDPMAERVMTRGHPELNARSCIAKAKSYEILSAVFFALALIPNYLLVLLILRYLIR